MAKVVPTNSVPHPAPAMQAIPHILHQTWRSADLPPHFARWRDLWRALHPDWEYRFYDDAAIRSVVAGRAPQWLPVLDALPRPIQRVDLFRYLIVFLDGGLYADLDMVPYRRSDPLLEGASCVLSVEQQVRSRRQAELGYRQPWQFANSIFAAVAGHPFLAELLAHIRDHAAAPVRCDDDVEESTGPRMLTRLAYDLPPARRGAIRVVPQIVWMSPWQYPRIWPLTLRLHARHVATGTWRLDRRWRTLWRHLLEFEIWPNPFAVRGPELP